MNLAGNNLKRLMLRMISGGVRENHDLEAQLRIILINTVSIIGILALIFFGLDALKKGGSGVGFFDFFIAFVLMITQLYLRRTGAYSSLSYFLVGIMGTLLLFLFVTGGINMTGHLWLYIFPLLSSFLLGSRKGAIASLGLLASSIILLGVKILSEGSSMYSTDFTLRFVSSFLVVLLSSYFFEQFREKTQQKLFMNNAELDKQIAKLTETEEALRKNQDELERRVENRTVELKNANKELQEEIVERRKTEELFRASEEKYRLLFENSFDVILSIDRQGKLVSVSPAVGRILGYKAEELVGRPVHELNIMHQEHMELALKSILRVLGGESIASHEYEFIAKDGTVKIAQLSSAPLFKDGQVVGLISIGRDITAQKRAAEELRMAHEELEMRVCQRTEELKKANEHLEAADRAKSEFLANMSHELRTPLTHIIGFTELVVDKKCGDLNVVQEEYLKDVWQSSQHLLSLINDILDLSKVEAGKLELEMAEIRLPALLEGSLGMVQEKAAKHGIRLLTDLDGVPEVIQGDERKMKQILLNLLSNAVKFTPQGGSVILSARYLSKMDGHWIGRDGQRVVLPLEVREDGKRPAGLMYISLRDTGIGIKGEDLQRIFDPFEQVDNSASRKYQGTGLGLSLTKRLVELHGGKIWAESEGEGKGSRFILVIPI